MKLMTILLMGILALAVSISACQNAKKDFNPEFEKLCKDRTPNNWMNMKPMADGKLASGESCWGCMSDDGMSHFCSVEEYKRYLENEK